MKNNCLNCSNSVGKEYRTMRKDMNLAMYKKCNSHKILPKKPSRKPSPIRKRRITGALADEEYSSDFMKFVKTGGSWSFRINKPLV